MKLLPCPFCGGEAIEDIVSSMSVCLSVDECHGMKRMQKRAIEEVKSLPPIIGE